MGDGSQRGSRSCNGGGTDDHSPLPSITVVYFRCLSNLTSLNEPCIAFILLYHTLAFIYFFQDGEAESYHNVEVEFVPGKHAKMTIYEDGVAGETIDMTLLITKDDMHNLMVDKGFEKLSAAEIEGKNKEKSELLSSGGTNTQKKKAVQRRETLKGHFEEEDRLRKAAKEARKEERKRKKEDREILGIDGLPNYMVQLYVGVFGVLLVVVYGGMRRERQRRRKPAASRVGLSS
jgi:hypothetical protein